ncbi:MAG: hypothetical protein QGH45_13480, partial [Myxococcota bacterium]|nr:hypothetical protein [Myxococcota bacterium]
IGDGVLVDERVLADAGGLAREPSLAYLDDGTILACWSTAADGFDWETRCTRETVAWYPAASASGAVDPVEVEVGGGIQPVVITAQVTMDETSTGFDRVSVQVPAPFEPAAGIELMVDEETPASAGWASDDTLWCQLEESIRDGVALRIEASIRPPLGATAPLPFVVRLHNGEDPYVTEVDGELTIAAVETAGDCQCRISARGPAGTTLALLVPFLLALRRQRRS